MSRDWADALSVRIYQSVVTDEKFTSIYGDDRNFAWYVRLLLLAKANYPAPTYVPAKCPRSALKALIAAGIVKPNGGLFTISGLDKEMAEAPDHQRAGGIVRAALAERNEGGRFVAGGPPPMTTTEDYDGRADIEAFVQVRRKPPTPRQKMVLDDVLKRHDVSGPEWAAKIILAHPDEPIGAVIEADRLFREGRKAAAVADERESEERHRRKPGIRDPLLQEIAKAMGEAHPERYANTEPVGA